VQAELAALEKRFKLTVMDKPKQFLGTNIDRHGSGKAIKVSARAYIEKMANDCLSKPPDSYPKLSTPCKPKLLEAYEEAKEMHADGHKPNPDLVQRYQTKLGKCMFACSTGVRADLAYPVGICARTATFPTERMEECLDHIIIHAWQTASDGVVFGASHNATLHGASDSDWHVSHSCSAHTIFYGEACVEYGSRRQQCIAMSSTEAEIIAASQAALEMAFLRTLLQEMGRDVSEPSVLLVDNSGACELAKHRKSCNRSRHVARRYFKVRELVAEGEILVQKVDTKENPADMLSKGTFEAAQYDYLKAKVMGRGAEAESPSKGGNITKMGYLSVGTFKRGPYGSNKVAKRVLISGRRDGSPHPERRGALANASTVAASVAVVAMAAARRRG